MLTEHTRRFRLCWHRPDCIITSSAAAHAPEWGWCWNLENRGKCIISAFCSGTECKPSTLTWPTKCLNDMIHEGTLKGITYHEAIKGYDKAVYKGVVKVMAKMGISTIKSYCGAQIFEAVGLGQELVDKYFTWTPSRVGGIGLEEIAREAQQQHARAFPTYPLNGHTLEAYGQYQYRKDGELHLFNPRTIHLLQKACRINDYKTFKEYTQLIDGQSERMATLRGLMELKYASKPTPIEEVEPVDAIVKRFKTGAMSYGSISKEAHEALAIAMNRIGGRSNTGEGAKIRRVTFQIPMAIRAIVPLSKLPRGDLASRVIT